MFLFLSDCGSQEADFLDIFNNKHQTPEVTYTLEREKQDMRKLDNDRGVPDEQRLMKYLFVGYEKTVRPVRNASTPVVIRMGLTFTQIFDMVSHWIENSWL